MAEHTSCLLTPGEPRVVPPVSFFTRSSNNTFITGFKTFAFCRNSVCRIHVTHSLSTLFLESEGGWRPGWKHMAPFTSRAVQVWAGWGLSNTRSVSGVITARGRGSYEGSYTWGGFLRPASCFLYLAIIPGSYEDILFTFLVPPTPWGAKTPSDWKECSTQSVNGLLSWKIKCFFFTATTTQEDCFQTSLSSASPQNSQPFEKQAAVVL